MKAPRTFLRRDLYRLVYKYSRAARQEGLDLEFVFGDLRRKGEYKNKALRNGYFKRCPFDIFRLNGINRFIISMKKTKDLSK